MDRPSIMKRTDRSSGIGLMEICNNYFIDFQNNCNCKDSWTSLFPMGIKYNCLYSTKNTTRSRIDYIFII